MEKQQYHFHKARQGYENPGLPGSTKEHLSVLKGDLSQKGGISEKERKILSLFNTKGLQDGYFAIELTMMRKMELLTVIPEIIDVYRNKLKKKNPDLLKGILLSASDEPYTLYIDYRKGVRNHQYSIVNIEIKEKEDPPEGTNLA